MRVMFRIGGGIPRSFGNRLEYVDLFRGIGILLMIISHIGFGRKYDYWVHAFNMPMFFFVTGFFAKPVTDVYGRFKIKVKKMMKPYAITGIFHLILWYILYPEQISLDPALALIWINTNNMLMCGALWFLTALLIADGLFSLLQYHLKNEWCLMTAVFLFVSFGMGIPKVCGLRLPWAADAAFVGLGIIYIASRLRGNLSYLFEIKSIVWLIIGGVVFTGLIFFNGYINMRTANYANPFLFFINSVGACIVGLNLCRIIHDYFSKGILGKIISYVEVIGKQSLLYVCFNQIVIFLFQTIAQHMGGHVVIRRTFILACTMILLEMIRWIFSHSVLKKYFIV